MKIICVLSLAILAVLSLSHAVRAWTSSDAALVAPTVVAIERHYGSTGRALQAMGEGFE